MTLVTLDKIVRRFGDFPILDGLSLRVDEGDRIGVVGDNGAGKTTMVRILAGIDPPDTGQRNPKRNLRIAYGAQMPRMPEGTTIEQFVMHGTGEHAELEARMRKLEAEMAGGSDSALRSYGELQAAFEAGGGYDRKHQVEKVLTGIGFPIDDWQKDISVLSGGEKSYTTLCLLLALGRVTSVPFAIFDEIDVFMDDGAKFSLLLRTIVVT